LVDLYDNVPYDEAFLGESDFNFNPIINTGEEVYTSIYNLLDSALSKDFSGLNLPDTIQLSLYFMLISIRGLNLPIP